MTPSIQRSDVTGQMKTTLIKISEQLKALSIDREDKRLFWVQFGLHGESAIASCDYNGNVLHIIDQPVRWACCCITITYVSFYFCLWFSNKKTGIKTLLLLSSLVRSQSLGTSIFQEYLYYTDAVPRVIRQVNKYTGGEPLNVNKKQMAKPPGDIKVVHPLNQPMADSQSSFPGYS